MTIPLSKAKAVCTSSEFALVRASRKPELSKLSPERSKTLAGRARKAVDKWQDLSRGQARAGSAGARTRLKVDLFRDALKRFEAKVAALPAGASTVGGKRAGKAKRARARGHRKARAAVRQELGGATPVLSARANVGGPGVVRKRARKVKVVKRGKPAVATARAKKSRTVSWTTASKEAKVAASPEKQRTARTKAKQARFVESGVTSRVRGHVSASGKRTQAHRDRKRSKAGR